MTSGYQPIRVDGATLGYSFVTEAGEIALAELDGTIVALWDEDAGETVSVEPGWTVADARYPGFIGEEAANRLAEYDQRLDSLEQQMYAPEPQCEQDEGLTEEQEAELIGAYVVSELDREGQRRGAAFTRDEQITILDGWAPDTQSIEDRVQAAISNGEVKTDPLANRQDRQDFILSRMQDGERDERDQGLDEPDPPADSSWEPDLDNRQQRVDWMVDRMAGRVPPANAYEAAETS